MLYVALGVLALAALGAVVLPLIRSNPPVGSRRERDLSVYRDQLRELEREIGEGRLGEDLAVTVRAEIGRRILAAGHQDDDPEHLPSKTRVPLAVVLALALAGSAAGLYAMLGSPGLPGQPSAGRFDSAEALEQTPVVVLLERLADRLESRPDDIEGWTLLGRTAMTTGRFDFAERAFINLARLQPKDVEPLVQLAQARLAQDEALISPEVKALFDEVSRRDPRHPAPRYYLALHEFQAGRYQEAYDRWTALMADTPLGASWRPALIQGLQQSVEALGIEAPSPSAPGPSTEDVRAASAMTKEDRDAMIAGMVEGLAARLEEEPDDLDGWKRLARAYAVLGEGDKEAHASENILRLDGDDLGALKSLAEAAEAVGESVKALGLWQRLLSKIPKETIEYQKVSAHIAALRGR